MSSFGAAVNAGDRAELIQCELVTGTYFGTLGIGPVRGRLLGPDDDRVPGAHAVAVISSAYWQRRFAGDPQIVGRTLSINSQSMTIIGVVEPGFDGMNLATATQVFVPVAMDTAMRRSATDRLAVRGARWLNVFARLKPGVTPAQAAAILEPFHRSIREQEVREDARFARATALTKQLFVNEHHIQVVPSPEGYSPIRGRMERPLWMLMAIVCGVLLIACANVANLLLARGASRQREIAVRLAIGASRGRIVRQLLVESLLLAGLGAAGGLFLATAGAHLLIGFVADADSITLISPTPDLRILGFTGAVALLTVLLFGVVPALQSTKPSLAPTLKDQAGSVVGGAHVRTRKALVISQITLSLLLLIGAGLFIRSLNSLMRTDLGFKPDHLLTFAADPTLVGYKGTRITQYATDLRARVLATPGVSAAAFSRIGLLWGGSWGNSIVVEGYQPKPDEEIGSRLNAVSPGYFEAVGIPLLMGRDFHEGDARAAGPVSEAEKADEGYRVAIVSESFVKRYIQGHPLGRHIGMGSDPGTPTRIEIVGVVKDSTYTRPHEERQWQLYFPFLEGLDAGAATFYVRTAQDPESMLQTMRQVMQQLDPAVPPMSLRTLDVQLKRSLVNQRLVTGLSAVFGLLATLLAMVGLYGVMAYSVTRRTREIGIRMALGAVAPRVVWLIMREALALIAIGVAVALSAATWLSRYIQSELYNTPPTDPVAIGGAVLALTAVAAAAGLIPAARAARINPIRALRHE